MRKPRKTGELERMVHIIRGINDPFKLEKIIAAALARMVTLVGVKTTKAKLNAAIEIIEMAEEATK